MIYVLILLAAMSAYGIFLRFYFDYVDRLDNYHDRHKLHVMLPMLPLALWTAFWACVIVLPFLFLNIFQKKGHKMDTNWSVL